MEKGIIARQRRKVRMRPKTMKATINRVSTIFRTRNACTDTCTPLNLLVLLAAM